MTRRDYILNHFATKFAADNPQVNPVAATAVGAGTLSALVAAVLSKKGKRLRNAGIAGVAGAAAGAGGGAAIGAQRKKRAQQAAPQQEAPQEAPQEVQDRADALRAEQFSALIAEQRKKRAQQAAQAEAQRIAQDAAQQPKAPYSAL